MDTTKPHGFFLASFLVLMFLGDPTDTCKCKPTSVQRACCKDDFVMRAHFMWVRRGPDFPVRLNMFRIYPVQVFKGPEYVRILGILYSPESPSLCAYRHKGPLTGDDYLISGLTDENGISITKCHFAKPWNEVNVKDKERLKNLNGSDCISICPYQ